MIEVPLAVSLQLKILGTDAPTVAALIPSVKATSPRFAMSGTMPRVTPGTSRCEMTVCEKRVSFTEFSLRCSSRACLGKCLLFSIYKIAQSPRYITLFGLLKRASSAWTASIPPSKSPASAFSGLALKGKACQVITPALIACSTAATKVAFGHTRQAASSLGVEPSCCCCWVLRPPGGNQGDDALLPLGGQLRPRYRGQLRKMSISQAWLAPRRAVGPPC